MQLKSLLNCSPRAMDTRRVGSRRRTDRLLGTSKERWNVVRPTGCRRMETAATTPSFLKRRTSGVGGQVRLTISAPGALGCSKVVSTGAHPAAPATDTRLQRMIPAPPGGRPLVRTGARRDVSDHGGRIFQIADRPI